MAFPNPKPMKKFIFGLLLAALCVPTLAQAEGCPAPTSIPETLEISALYPQPLAGEQEWVELKNTGAQTLDLSQYTLEDSTAHPKTLSGSLNSQSKIRITNLGFQLNNGEEVVVLRTINGTELDRLAYSTSTAGQSITPGASTSIEEEEAPSPSATPKEWPLFSEALPNPEGSDTSEEWIELYNPYSHSLQLAGLSLDDMESGSKPYALTGSISGKSYLLISIEDSKISLNNGTDSIRLLGIAGKILWDITYEDAKEGESYADFDGEQYWTKELTPGEENLQSSGASDPSANGDLSEDLSISEVFPNPEGADQDQEWIEITNGGDSTIDLGNWALDDGPEGSDPYLIPGGTLIEPGQTLVFGRAESKLALNNSKESVRLLDYKGDLMDEIYFETSIEGESYSKIQLEKTTSLSASLFGSGAQKQSFWEWSKPSPGSPNPKWFQLDGTVEAFTDGLLTFNNGIESYQIQSNLEAVDALLLKVGNRLSLKVSKENGSYFLMGADLLEQALSQPKNSFPWLPITASTLVGIWALQQGYEQWKKRALPLSSWTPTASA